VLDFQINLTEIDIKITKIALSEAYLFGISAELLLEDFDFPG